MSEDLISRKKAYEVLTEYYHHKTEMQHKALREALNMVPSAELQPTCNQLATDCISRQAAINAIIAKLDAIDHVPQWVFDKLTGAIGDLPSAQPERTCVNCGRTANNGGWYADGRTRCPIEEHYALPKDGYFHLWEKRNVTDDDYPERQKNEQV